MPPLHPSVVKLILLLARLVPPVAWVLAAAFGATALAFGVFGVGDYTPAARVSVSGLFALFGVVSIGIGVAVPLIVQRILPPQ